MRRARVEPRRVMPLRGPCRGLPPVPLPCDTSMGMPLRCVRAAAAAAAAASAYSSPSTRQWLAGSCVALCCTWCATCSSCWRAAGDSLAAVLAQPSVESSWRASACRPTPCAGRRLRKALTASSSSFCCCDGGGGECCCCSAAAPSFCCCCPPDEATGGAVCGDESRGEAAMAGIMGGSCGTLSSPPSVRSSSAASPSGDCSAAAPPSASASGGPALPVAALQQRDRQAPWQ